jgi:putative methyltransferase (TIGR04325 family)
LLARYRTALLDFRLEEPKVDGYDDDAIDVVVVEKTARFYSGDHDYILTKMAGAVSRLAESSDNILDFGGGAGIAYLAARFHRPLRRFRWAVVERPAMVALAKQFETDHLRFFNTCEDAAHWLKVVDLVHSNSAIQYVPDPEAMVRRLLALKPLAVHWDRTPLAPIRIIEQQQARLGDHGPGSLRRDGMERIITHRLIKMASSDFEALHSGYRLIERGEQMWRWARLP